jgi:hypothetical protein
MTPYKRLLLGNRYNSHVHKNRRNLGAEFPVRYVQRLYKDHTVRVWVKLRVAQRRIAVAEARRLFGNPEERKRLPLESDTRGLLKTLQAEKIYCMP